MNPAAPPVSPLSAGGLAQLTSSLLAIVALIFAVSWLLKRLKMTGPRGRGDLAVIDQIAIGPRERIVLLRAGDAQVLIGVCPGGMTDLKPLAAPLAAAADPGAAPPRGGSGLEAATFAERLREFMKPQGRT